MSSSGKRQQSTEAPTKRSFSKFFSRKKKDKEKGEEDAGLRTCEEVPESGGGGASAASPGSPVSIKQKRKKKKKDGKEGTVEEDETVKGKKKEKEKDKDDLKTAKRKKGSRADKREKTEEAAPAPSGMATVFEAVKAPSRPAVAHRKDVNEHIKEDMERIEKEEKEKEKEKQPKPIDEFAPTVFEPVQAPSQPAIASAKMKKQPRQMISPDPEGTTREQKPIYLTIPKESAVAAREKKDSKNKKLSAESTTTGKERSKKEQQKHSDSQDDGADCKTAMIPASAVKVGPYQMVMYKGVPRYEPVTNPARPYVKSEKEVAAKIQILPQPTTPTSPTLPGVDNYNNNNGVKTPPKSPPASSPGNGNKCGGIVIGNLPKDAQSPSDDPKKDGPSPVSQYVAPLDR